MKNKTVKMILAVAALLICCGGYAGVKYYVAKQEEAQAAAEEEDETTSVVSLSSDDVKSLEFIIDKKEVVFEKDDDTWVKQDEKEFPVNQTTLDNAVSGVVSLDSEWVLEDVEDLSEYGLSEPSNTIKITAENSDGEEETITLRIGDENESESKYYISKDEDRNTVYLVDNTAVEAFSNELYDYAQGEDFPVISSTDKISKISVSGDDISSYELNKDEDTSLWYIGSGEEKEKADSASVSSLTTSFGSLAYDSFVDYDCTDKGEYGLDKPYAVISVDYQEEVSEEEASDLETDEGNEENTDSESSVETDVEVEDVEAESETAADETESEDLNDADDENASEEVDADEEASEESIEEVAVDDEETLEEIVADEDEALEEATADDDEVLEEVTADEDEALEEVAADDEETLEEVATGDDESLEEVTTDDEDASEEVDTDGENTEDSEETQTVLVDKNLTITIGDETSDGSRYVVVNDSNQIYTMSSDSLLTFLGKTDSDFWDMTVNYLYIDNLESLDVNYGGEEYTVNVSRETSENEDGEEETTTEYSLNGTQIDKTDFTTFYNKLINMAGQKRLSEQYETDEEAEMTVTFVSTEGEKTEVRFYSYDTNYYAAVVGEKVYLVNKMNVKELFTAFEELTGIEEEETTGDPDSSQDDNSIENELDENVDVDENTNAESSDTEEVTE